MGFIVVQWTGCSVEKNYDLLSTFFDGVPNPNEIDIRSGDAMRKSPTFSIHPPYRDDACSECHPNPSEMLLSREDGKICLKCHEDITSQYPYMHGAVVGLACLWCHNPHMSPFANLTRDPAPKLCNQCHDWSGPKMPVPTGHEDYPENCLICHSGHGGDKPAFVHEPTETKEPDSPEQSTDQPDQPPADASDGS